MKNWHAITLIVVCLLFPIVYGSLTPPRQQMAFSRGGDELQTGEYYRGMGKRADNRVSGITLWVPYILSGMPGIFIYTLEMERPEFFWSKVIGMAMVIACSFMTFKSSWVAIPAVLFVVPWAYILWQLSLIIGFAWLLLCLINKLDQ